MNDYSISRAVVMMEIGNKSIPMFGIISRARDGKNGNAVMIDTLNEILLNITTSPPIGRYHFEHVTPTGQLRRRVTGFDILDA